MIAVNHGGCVVRSCTLGVTIIFLSLRDSAVYGATCNVQSITICNARTVSISAGAQPRVPRVPLSHLNE